MGYVDVHSGFRRGEAAARVGTARKDLSTTLVVSSLSEKMPSFKGLA